MSSFADTVPKMHDLYDVLLARALAAFNGQDMPPAALHRLVRSIARMVRMIIAMEVWVYQRAVKAKMLSDPAWRSRVIEDLGGYWALRRWRARMALGYQPPRERPEDRAQPNNPERAGRHIDPRQFRLAPYPRDFYGSKARDIFALDPIYTPAPSISGFDRPIPITPDELAPLPPAEPPRHVYYPNDCPYCFALDAPPPPPVPVPDPP